MNYCTLIDSRLDSCRFLKSDLRNLNCNSLFDLVSHRRTVTTVAISANGKYLVSGSLDNTIKLWNFELHSELFTLNGHSDGLSSVVFSTDSKYLASASYDSTIKLWSLESIKEISTLRGSTG